METGKDGQSNANSTISGNIAVGRPGGASYGGGIRNGGMLTVNDSTIGGNTAAGDFYPEHSYGVGGGIANFGTLTLNNSTISGNANGGGIDLQPGGFGGGIYNDNAGSLTVNNGTVSGNSSASGSGIFNYGTATLQNTIVAYNNSGSDENCDGTQKATT